MRLDEWQKYIDSQFLDEEPAPVPTPKAPKVIEETVNPEPLPKETAKPAADAELITQEALFTAVFAEEPDPAPLTSPESAPIVVQNTVTLVVAPPQSPIQPLTGRAPRIEVLTPLPETPPEPKPVTSATEEINREEVTNRTRRRSQVAESSPALGSDSSPDTPSLLSNNFSSERMASQRIASEQSAADVITAEPNTAGIQPAPIRTSVPLPSGLFEPISDLDADIPVFQRYLPSSHAAAMPVEAPATRGLQAPLPFLPETPETQAEYAEKQSDLPDNSLDTITEEEGDLPVGSEADHVRRAPKSRARHARNVRPENVPSGLSAAELWAAVPRHVQTLLSLERLEEKEVAQFSYKRQFQEKRHELIERLLDPILSLEDTARLLNVCPTTVRRYTNKGILTYYRKEPERNLRNGGETHGGETHGGETAVPNEKETRQRRFRLSDILAFLETQQTAIESDRQAEHQAERRRLARAANTIAVPPLEPNTISDTPPTGKDS